MEEEEVKEVRKSLGGAHLSASELEERILKKREERFNKNSEGVSEVLSWVSRSRKLEEKRNAEKEKALRLSKIFAEQDNVGQGDSEDEEESHGTAHNLAGVKVLHGIDKVVEGGAVVLTLKDQNILADGDINEEIDMLENVELGEQKQRDEAYKAAKKKTGIYEDKFNDDPSAEKKMLPQYDDPTADEGLALDERGRFSGEAEKKLQEVILSPNLKKKKKKKKKKNLENVGEEWLRLRMRNCVRSHFILLIIVCCGFLFIQVEDENPVFADEDDDLYKSLERARKLALKKQEEEAASGPQAIARLATTASSQTAEDLNPTTGESQENKVVFTEMEEFVWGLQLDEEARKPENEDVFMQEDEEPRASDEEVKDEASGWTEVKDEIVPDEAIHEVAVGKGLSGVLKLLKDRGTLKESIEWGGRNMDKKKSKLVGIVDDDEPKEPRSSALVDFKKEIRIERTDEFGRIATFLTDPKSVDTDMDAKVKAMIMLIEEDADSIARRAEMYYKKRPELMKLVEEFYRAYRALAERYDHAELVSELGDDLTQAATKTEVLVSILGDDLTLSCMS
ncbi:hypothetical protein SO802_018829 [Lithocarpus litseifolius]|uniref:NAB domain-containing protein n=1 Tax=Lithocarpus litseifolius TaxID=425828 RepID=A0AAW2CLW7_9ROSI